MSANMICSHAVPAWLSSASTYCGWMRHARDGSSMTSMRLRHAQCAMAMGTEIIVTTGVPASVVRAMRCTSSLSAS